MAIGSVSVTQQNTNSGSTSEVERTVLFIGSGGASATADAVHAISQDTDLDSILGSEDSDLKTNIQAALNNASTNFTAFAIALDALDWAAAITLALDTPEDKDVEMIALTDAITAAVSVDELQAAAVAARNTWAKLVSIHAATAGIAADQSWSEYIAAQTALQTDKVADRVSLVPQLHGNNLGVVIGRLANEEVSIADSPMRVATGAVVNLGTAPEDKDGNALTMAHIKSLADQRLSVPQWYTGYDGTYWADHPVLDAEGGDFQVIEHRRVIDYLARRIRIKATSKIGDRKLNSSDSSIAYHESYFMETIQTAAKSTTINGEVQPGLVETPSDGDIAISWPSTKSVDIYMQAKPYDCPKAISTYISLDL